MIILNNNEDAYTYIIMVLINIRQFSINIDIVGSSLTETGKL